MTLSKLALAFAIVAAFGTTAAFADDTHLQNRLAMQQREEQRNRDMAATTVAVYSERQGLGANTMVSEMPSENRFELRSTAHGQVFGLYVPAH